MTTVKCLLKLLAGILSTTDPLDTADCCLEAHSKLAIGVVAIFFLMLSVSFGGGTICHEALLLCASKLPYKTNFAASSIIPSARQRSTPCARREVKQGFNDSSLTSIQGREGGRARRMSTQLLYGFPWLFVQLMLIGAYIQVGSVESPCRTSVRDTTCVSAGQVRSSLRPASIMAIYVAARYYARVSNRDCRRASIHVSSIPFGLGNCGGCGGRSI